MPINTLIPHATEDGNGVCFTATVDFVNRDCFVSKEAVAELSPKGGRDQDLMPVFPAYEANVKGIARRLVAACIQENPLQVSKRTVTAA